MNIDPNDIAMAVQIIDIACARGAIRGEEMATVGQLRTKFAQMLEQASKEQAADQPADD